MNIKIESVQNDLSLSKRVGFWRIVDAALFTNSIDDFHSAIIKDDSIRDEDFFIYMGSNHIAVHEMINGAKCIHRLLFITL